ncbi:MAG: arylesterase [Gammaproteobacteria bacterium]|jgi:acyl-CoA thioesterase-1|tara:strand:+ start:16 stop:645 length:630 start_codon:yes stop_codon:yes gene_type:complete
MSFLEISKYKNLFIFVLIFSNSIIADDKKLLILGDSISAGFGIKESQNWTTLLKSSFSKEGKSLEIINSSISGDTTSGGLSRINRDLNTYKPDFVLVELGGNDALRGYPISRIKQNLLKIISIISNNQSIPIIMQIKIPPNYGKKYIEAFENIYSEVASETDAKLISFMLENVALREDLMQPDGIHPNEKAQPFITEQIKKEIGYLIFN